MPTYRYICQFCKTEKEEYLHMNHRNTVQLCPKCRTIMERITGVGAGFYPKGDGYYKNGWNI